MIEQNVYTCAPHLSPLPLLHLNSLADSSPEEDHVGNQTQQSGRNQACVVLICDNGPNIPFLPKLNLTQFVCRDVKILGRRLC